MDHSSSAIWNIDLEEQCRSQAASMAVSIASFLADVGSAQAASDLAKQQTQFPEYMHWRADGVAQGNAGLSLLFSQLDMCQPGQGWDTHAHQHLLCAARSLELDGSHSDGIFSGLSGVAYCTLYASRGGSRYAAFLDHLDETLVDSAQKKAAEFAEGASGMYVSEFDLISGATGLAAYLLTRSKFARNKTTLAVEALDGIVASLASLVVPIVDPPRWYTPPTFMFDDDALERFPDGSLNCGLAHGAPGILAVLSLYRMNRPDGVAVDEAIDVLSQWVIDSSFHDACGITWPTVLPVRNTNVTLLKSSRTAWCYGAPGIARALYHSGVALNNAKYKSVAIEALYAVFRKSISQRRIDSPTFCHGIAGLLQIALRFYNDEGIFSADCRSLFHQLASSYSRENSLGFGTIEADGRVVFKPELLDGAAGVALVLLSAAFNVDPGWDRLFLLS